MSNFNNIYKGKKVLITGHTGFKGSWLSLWLHKLGADVYGFSDHQIYKHTGDLLPDFFRLITFHPGDISKFEDIEKVIEAVKPNIVFHLAAQPIVSTGYQIPHYTYNVNTVGTLNLLEAVRQYNKDLPVVCVLTDKIYKETDQFYSHRETDALGGYDPYSNSKSCAEQIIETYRNCYLTHVASCAAGNCVGGGDFGQDRLIPDIVRAIEKGTVIEIKNMDATRPWMYVLDVLKGYLMVGSELMDDNIEASTLWNFGPKENQRVTVADIIKIFQLKFDIPYKHFEGKYNKETMWLSLDSTKANFDLGWYPDQTQETAIYKAIRWYDAYLKGNIITEEQLEEYL